MRHDGWHDTASSGGHWVAACFPLVTIGLGLTPHLSFTVMGAALAGLCLLALGILLGQPLSRGARTWGLVALLELRATTLVFLGMLRAAEFISLASQTSRALVTKMDGVRSAKRSSEDRCRQHRPACRG
jgi:hypothetical protein